MLWQGRDQATVLSQPSTAPGTAPCFPPWVTHSFRQQDTAPACSSGTLNHTDVQGWCSYTVQRTEKGQRGGQAQGTSGVMTLLKQVLAHPCALWHGDSGGGQRELSTMPGAEPGCSWYQHSWCYTGWQVVQTECTGGSEGGHSFLAPWVTAAPVTYGCKKKGAARLLEQCPEPPKPVMTPACWQLPCLEGEGPCAQRD